MWNWGWRVTFGGGLEAGRWPVLENEGRARKPGHCRQPWPFGLVPDRFKNSDFQDVETENGDLSLERLLAPQ